MRSLDLSPGDHEGAGKLYGHVQTWTDQTNNVTVPKGSLVHSWSIVPGGRFLRATTTGTGNVDLYMGVGFPPSPTHYTSRSVRKGSIEGVSTVTDNFPYGVDVFFGMFGASGGTVNLRVDFERLMNPADLVGYIPARTATYRADFLTPACPQAAVSCDSGALLNGRLNLAGGAESQGPNTSDGCVDGSQGTYLSDESIERIVVTSPDGSPLRLKPLGCPRSGFRSCTRPSRPRRGRGDHHLGADRQDRRRKERAPRRAWGTP